MIKHKKVKKNLHGFLFLTGGLIVIWLTIGFFLFFNKVQEPMPDSMYVFPENPKQGDTVFIRVKSQTNEIAGSFNNQKIFFYKKKDPQEWISFLGIDVDQKPGDYQVSVDTYKEHLTKEIKITLADFSSQQAVPAPSLKQKGYTNEKAVNDIVKNDNPVIKEVLSNFTPEPYFNGPFSFPLSAMQTSGFSFGKFIGFGKYALQHLGVDLRASEKTEIYAVNNGKVVATLNLSNYGKTVIIDHGLDIFSMYLHLEKFEVSNGQMVKKGQVIGLSGDTGYVTAPHLHFSIRVDGSRVDPVAFIEATKEIDDNSILANISGEPYNIISQK